MSVAVRLMFVFVALLVALHHATSLQLLRSTWLKDEPLYRSLSSSRIEPRAAFVSDLLNEFPGLKPALERARRQSTSSPLTNSFAFNDTNIYGYIRYSGAYSKVIFLLTSNAAGTQTNLYRSGDYGVSFTNIESTMDPADRNPVLWRIFYTNPKNKNFLAFPHATRSQMYITRDEGLTFTKVNFSQTINPRSLQWYPGEDNWILGLNTQSDVLYVTQDTGTSWTLVDNYVDNITDFQWGDPTIDPAHIVYYNVYDPTDRSRGNYTVHLYTKQPPFTNAAQEFDPNLGRHDDFLLLGQYIFAQQTQGDSGIMLKVSYNRKPFQIARIPSTFGHVNYIVSHINNLQALVIVQHVQGQYNLYLSDSSGVYYSMSLPDLVQEGGTTFDLEMIEGVNGTMVANQYVRSDPSQTNSPIRTLITFNNGGRWRLIEPPDVDVNGNAVNCEPPSCSLHFFMDTSDYFRLGVYAQDSAPGLIVAHGSLGAQLSSDPDVYISRNGGITWSQTLSNSWGLNYLDHGGLLVAARDYHQAPSTVLKYSVDEGLHWQDYTFSNVNAYVFGVITEPGETTTIVSLYGWTSGASGWIVWTVNFTSVFSRYCTDNDYYTWSPWDERLNEACALGYRRNIDRRYASSACLNSRSYVRETNFTTCSCASEDFECDFGFMRVDGVKGPCVTDTAILSIDPCTAGASVYNKSSGYRRIAGDGCVGGVEAVLTASTTVVCGGPTSEPTAGPTSGPFSGPTSEPTSGPTSGPFSGPTSEPTAGPFSGPTSGSSTGGSVPTDSRSGYTGTQSASIAVLAVLFVLAMVLVCALTVIVVLLFLKLKKARLSYQRVGFDLSDEDDEPVSL
eukprot:Em0013g101a